jgi:hypothetical protein
MSEFVPADGGHTFPVSVKGVAVQDGRVLLLQASAMDANWPVYGRALG